MSPNANEYKSVVGVDQLYIAEVSRGQCCGLYGWTHLNTWHLLPRSA